MSVNRVVTVAIVGASGILVGMGTAQPEGMDMAAAMQRWMDSIKPNERHEGLAWMAGTWDVTVRFGIGDSKAVSNFEAIHGGRFIKEEMEGVYKIPQADGTIKDVPVTGLGLTGYDNNKKLYTTVWSDSMNTGLMHGTGNMSQDGKTLTVFSSMDEPMTGEMGKAVRVRTIKADDDHFSMKIDEVLYGEPFTVVEFEYARRK